MERERAELQRQQEELAALLSKKAHNYDELAEQKDALRRALDELNAKFDQQNTEMRNLKDELKMMQKEKAQLMEKDAYLEEKAEVLKQLLDQETEDKNALDALRKKDNASSADAAAAAASAADDLKARLKKTQDTLDHEKALRDIENKMLDELRARAAGEKTGLELLKKHLELHVGDLHRWQKYLNFDPDAFADFDDETAKLLATLDGQATFAEQVDFLTEKLDAENQQISRMLKAKKAEAAETATTDKKKSSKKKVQ